MPVHSGREGAKWEASHAPLFLFLGTQMSGKDSWEGEHAHPAAGETQVEELGEIMGPSLGAPKSPEEWGSVLLHAFHQQAYHSLPG